MLNHYLSAIYSHLENRTLSVYWNSRNKVIELLNAQRTDHVLELGSSSGNWSAYFSPKVELWVGVEIEFAKIQLAKVWRSTRIPYFPNIEKTCFICGSGESLPFSDMSFEKCFSTDVIEHIEDDFRVLREIYRILKPNGTVVMTTLLKARPHYLHKLDFQDHIREYSTESFSEIFMSAGFTIQEIFYFYHAPTMIARELQVGLLNSYLGSFPIVSLALSIPLKLLADIEHIAKIGKPGGIGILARKQ